MTSSHPRIVAVCIAGVTLFFSGCGSDGSDISAAEHACNLLFVMEPTELERQQVIARAVQDGATSSEILAICGPDGDRPLPAVVTTIPSPAEKACPGSAVEVAYHAGGTTSGGTYTIQTPSGTKQGEYSTPLENKSGTRGLRFCFSPGEFVYISVQNENDRGSISCKITVDGLTIAENESNGAYVIAQCDGST